MKRRVHPGRLRQSEQQLTLFDTQDTTATTLESTTEKDEENFCRGLSRKNFGTISHAAVEFGKTTGFICLLIAYSCFMGGVPVLIGFFAAALRCLPIAILGIFADDCQRWAFIGGIVCAVFNICLAIANLILGGSSIISIIELIIFTILIFTIFTINCIGALLAFKDRKIVPKAATVVRNA